MTEKGPPVTVEELKAHLEEIARETHRKARRQEKVWALHAFVFRFCYFTAIFLVAALSAQILQWFGLSRNPFETFVMCQLGVLTWILVVTRSE